MVREFKNKIFLILSMIALLTIITGCSSLTGVNTKYYTGYNSVEMKFLTDTPPSTFNYDSQATDINVNTIPINVELDNKGSSNSYGALFVYGFDPKMIAVQAYSSNYPSSLGYTGPVRTTSTSAFSGWYGNSNTYAVQAIGVPIGNSIVNLGLTSINGQQSISFSSFGLSGSGAFANRGAMFSAMNFQTRASAAGYGGISTGVVQAQIGSALNPITMGMMSTFGWGAWLKHFQLEGRNSNNPGGGMDVVEFPAVMLPNFPPSLEQFRQRIMVTSCFDYATHASTMVCIDPNPYTNTGTNKCIPTTVSLGGGQGAPVAITTIEQRPGKGRTTFVINVHHYKQNTDDALFDYFSLYKCDPASGAVVKTNDKNVVYVGYVYLSDMDITMSCMPDQVIRLDDSGNGQITCSINFDPTMAASAYEAPIEVELWYGYSKTIYKDVYITRI